MNLRILETASFPMDGINDADADGVWRISLFLFHSLRQDPARGKERDTFWILFGCLEVDDGDFPGE